jgi:hypothetical protein
MIKKKKKQKKAFVVWKLIRHWKWRAKLEVSVKGY